MSKATNKRTVLTLELRPVVGSRFQPTGFPDLGAATFERVGTEGESLLVESVQSMANHLEATTWDATTNEPADDVAALPHVRVVDATGNFLTSSRLEAHRLAAAYVLEGTIDGQAGGDVLYQRFGIEKNRPLDPRRVATEIFALDPVSLLHGVFFSRMAIWQPRVARAVTSFIEASNVRAAVSGGVKKDSVNPASDKSTGQDSGAGYGMVPHHRVEYTAAQIQLLYVIDEQQLRSYGLSEHATELLSALAAYELASLLDGGLRLRTACDLVVSDGSAALVPSLDAARTRLSAAIDAARPELGETTEVVWTGSKGKATKKPDKD